MPSWLAARSAALVTTAGVAGLVDGSGLDTGMAASISIEYICPISFYGKSSLPMLQTAQIDAAALAAFVQDGVTRDEYQPP
jgi:hypothetical protein